MWISKKKLKNIENKIADYINKFDSVNNYIVELRKRHSLFMIGLKEAVNQLNLTEAKRKFKIDDEKYNSYIIHSGSLFNCLGKKVGNMDALVPSYSSKGLEFTHENVTVYVNPIDPIFDMNAEKEKNNESPS